MLFDKFITVHSVADIWPHIEKSEQSSFFIKDFKSPTNDAFRSQVIFYNTCYNGIFTDPVLAEARGITFNENGDIILRPLHKFFNVGENEHVTIDKLKERGIVDIYDKVDGSMINFYVYKDVLYAKSKKSWCSDVALECMEFLKKDMRRYAALKRVVETTQSFMTCTFEFTSPSNRIVVKYNEPKLTLLQCRQLYTGQYFNALGVYNEHFGDTYDFINPPKVLPSDIDALMESRKDVEGIEGYVVKTTDGNMAKLKCDWYVLLHRNVTFLRERDVAESVIEDCIDDVWSNLSQDESFILERERVKWIWDDVVNNLMSMQKQMEEYFVDVDELKDDPALYFKKYQDSVLARLAWSVRIKGADVHKNLIKHFKKTILKQQYSLDHIMSDDIKEKYCPDE